jgi:hypothetical protein
MSSSSSGGSYGGGGSKPHVLYGVWIDQALQSNDANQLKEVLTEVRKQYPGGKGYGGPIIPMYGVFINRCIESGASREELQQLLEHAKSIKDSDLDGAIKKLQSHLDKK